MTKPNDLPRELIEEAVKLLTTYASGIIQHFNKAMREWKLNHPETKYSGSHFSEERAERDTENLIKFLSHVYAAGVKKGRGIGNREMMEGYNKILSPNQNTKE